jgi:hypothetical protein
VRRTSSDFDRLFTITVVALTVLCAVFLGLSALQGPKLESAQVDVDRVTSETAQSVRLFANQALAEVDPASVTVTPAAPITVTTSGEVVAVTFTERLNYLTQYTVAVAGVQSAYGGTVSTLTYSFTTGDPELYYLDRGEPDDAIVRTQSSGAASEVVYSARHIQSFSVVTPTVFSVVVLNDDGTSDLTIIDTETGLLETVVLPAEGTISNFAASDSGTILGFEFTSTDPQPGRTYDRTLLRLDLDAGRDILPVAGLDGQPLRVLDWTFVPGSEDLIVQSSDQSVFRVSETAGLTPLGEYTRIGDISIDGAVLTVFDAFGAIGLTIATLEEQRLDPSPLNGATPTGGEVEVLPSGARVQRVVVFDEATGAFASSLVYDDGSTSRVLYETVDSMGSIETFRLSPNGQYVAIEAIPDFAASVDDGYAVARQSTSIQTVIVDVATGAVVRIVDGFDLAWAR